MAGVNFHPDVVDGLGDYKAALGDEEFRTYLLYIFAAVAIITVSLILVGTALDHALLDTLFHVLSIGTSTGYASADYGQWPGVARIILFLLMIVGACAGSTSGGLKLMRIRIGLKVAFRELARIAQPRKNSHDSHERSKWLNRSK